MKINLSVFGPEPLWQNKRLAVTLWFGLSLFILLQHLFEGTINNYLIYKGVFFHTLQQSHLYLPYPAEYGDMNHYGPFFSLVIAPFAWMPDQAGVLCWVMANAAFLLFAIGKLPLRRHWKVALVFLCANELMINTGQVQA